MKVPVVMMACTDWHRINRWRAACGERWCRHPVVVAWMVLLIFAMATAESSYGQAAMEAAAPAAGMTDAEVQEQANRATELKLLLGILREPKLDNAQRRDAAMGLIRRGWPDAIAELESDLRPDGDAGTYRAIAQAVAATAGQAPESLAPPMLKLLASADESLAADLGVALSRYPSSEIVNELVTVVQDDSTSPSHRRAAILALGHHRTQFVAGVLVDLLAKEKPGPMRDATSQALANLTGITAYGDDAERWRRWWQSHQTLFQRQWLDALLDNFARRTQALAAENRRIQDRLIDTHRQLYLATSKDDRPALLVRMMSDGAEPTRRLAVDLMAQRLIEQHPVGPELRQCLYRALDDESSAIRERAAKLLRDLRDVPGAEAIAARIGSESHPQVLRAYLVMMADLPQPGALDRVTQLLAEPSLHADAAGVLAAAAAQGLLGDAQVSALRARLHGLTQGDGPPQPKVIELLGRVGDDAAWAGIARWLDSADEPVKTAAAEAWAGSTRPLDALADRADDPLIQPILIRAATRRGDSPQVLAAMIRVKPQQQQLAESWQRAVIAMASRVPSHAALDADLALKAQGEPPSLREQVLTAAIRGPLDPATPPANPAPAATATPNTAAGAGGNGTTEVAASGGTGGGGSHLTPEWHARLLLARARVRILLEQPVQAMADINQITARQLPVNDVERIGLLKTQLHAHLLGGETDKALEAGQKLMAVIVSADDAVRTRTIADVVTLYLDAIRHVIAARQVEPAQKLMSHLRLLAGQQLTEAQQAEISDLAGRMQPPVSQTTESTAPAAGGETTLQ